MVTWKQLSGAKKVTSALPGQLDSV
jgi:hypothetical protein